jgi:protein TonB
MSKNLWTACLAASVFVHFLLLHGGYAPTVSTGAAVTAIPVNLDVSASAAPRGMSLSQHMAAPSGEGDGGEESDRARQQRLLRQYLETVRKEVERAKFRAAGATRERLIGKARFALTIAGDGSFTAIRLVRSSGDAALDAAAREAIRATSGRITRPSATGTMPVTARFTIKYQYGL